ncbi:MAG: molybdopterin-dependent oxidoreductase, partial [Spirochaetes bacterium]|nr:molybdopterin-dependent oxidoreductase [Spirochaetota bacterium]
MEKEIIFCQIDGKDSFVEKGVTIFEAAREVGIDIPALCYHPQLSISGSCRVCVVEVIGEEILYPACSTPVKNGMQILTNSERVINARKIVIEMILSEHLADCLTCDASGECLLEKYAYDYGATGTFFKKQKFNQDKHQLDDTSPFFVLERTKCILCGKCIRACNEWVHAGALSFIAKGNQLQISTLYNKGFVENKECISCGNCINVCPVGALVEKDAIRAGRVPEIEKIHTICPYCGVGCGIIVYKKDNKIIKVRGDDQSPVSAGRLCIKGKFGMDFVNSPERLTRPLIKDENGEFQEADLIDVLILIKQKIDETLSTNGGRAGLASARCTNEENYIFQKFVRTVLQTDNVDHCARICHSPSVAGLSATLGSGAMTNPIEDIDQVDCFFIIGSNMTSTHPVLSWKVINRIKQGAILILIDPRKSPLAKYATIHLQINPGSDIALIYSLIKLIQEEYLVDQDFLEHRCENVEEFFAELDKLDINELIKQTGLEEEDIRLAARLYAISGSSSIYYTMGITQHVFGTGNVMALANLALVTGKVGQGYTGVNPLRGQNNVQGACDMGALTGVLPGYKKIENPEDRQHFEKAWSSKLPEQKGLTLTEIMSQAKEGKINFLYIMGENPVLSEPDSVSVRKALEKVDFLIVQDIFLTETAQYADVILPAASFAEKNGTFTNTERRIQRVRKVIDSPGENVLPDWEFIQKIAELMGYDWYYQSWKDIFNEITSNVEIYKHLKPTKLDQTDSFWPADLLGQPLKRLHQDRFTRGKGKLIFHPVPHPYSITKEFPFLLIIGRLYEQYHTGTMTRKTKGINQ